MKLKPGDKVLIVRKASDHEKGWKNSWVVFMDDAIGRTGTVLSVESDHNVVVAVPAVIASFGYPDFVLQKIQE